MSKKDELDLDFSELGVSETVIEKSSKPKPKYKSRAQREKEELESILLLIPLKEEQNVFIARTIKECSGAEFVKWASTVYFRLNRSKDYYNNMENRKNEFKNIVKHHTRIFSRAYPNAHLTLH